MTTSTKHSPSRLIASRLIYLRPTALALLVLATAIMARAQDPTDIRVTDAASRAILAGDFDVADYPGGQAIDVPADLAATALGTLSPDSLKRLLLELDAFGNRNTGSDTTSATFGIGAARRWAHDRLARLVPGSGGRLQVGYLQFDRLTCDVTQHRNVLAVLPGAGPHADEVVLVEGHIDSRCAERCDVDCPADGMEDNASGTALVMELARVMSRYRWDRTIAFMLTTGEEQGLVGATAMADYAVATGMKLRAVLNNDVIGGVICGRTASPPGCPGLNDIDSVNVRLYSATSARDLARYTQLLYERDMAPLQAVPSRIQIQSAEDRTGRGGDHIPFRVRGIPAIRFTSANEHGDADALAPGYDDRQHTSDDVLGLDTDGDGAIDSFFVDFRYLYRNAAINANALGHLAAAPAAPTRVQGDVLDFRVAIAVEDPLGRDSFLLAVRDRNQRAWDTLLRVGAVDTIELGVARWNLSVAYLADDGRLSQFVPGSSVRVRVSGVGEVPEPLPAVELLPNYPNPFDDATTLRVLVNEAPAGSPRGELAVYDAGGRELARLPVALTPGLQEVLYEFSHHDYVPGTYSYSLLVDGRRVATQQMVYAY